LNGAEAKSRALQDSPWDQSLTPFERDGWVTGTLMTDGGLMFDDGSIAYHNYLQETRDEL
jgi:hypothetical protein